MCPRFSPDLSQGQTRRNPRDKPGVVPRPTGQKNLCLRKANEWPRKGNGPPPPVTGTGALLIVENAFDCNGSPYGFNCQGSRGAPKTWPKYHCGRKRYIISSETFSKYNKHANIHLLIPKSFMHVSLTCLLTCWGMIRM